MPRRIAILPDAVADQIAAGEVVERPGSAVKELVENALDAGARHVRVDLEHGGKTLIEVSDDGCGMGREDAVLALDRHATSKIRSAADLVGIRSFGFRGEALPAIASVSRFRLVTSEDGNEGTEIGVTGGRVDGVNSLARQRGTTVTVRGLFFNTPARRKFLRSVPSETRAAHDALATLALTHPEVGFELYIDGRSRLAVPPDQSPDERLAAIWGHDLVKTLIPLEHAVGSFRVTGFIQRPGDAAPTGRRTQLFINDRPFRDPFLVRAAEAGYRSAIHPGDRPSLFLKLETAPEEVDVNVHPAKLEVRFRDRLGAERAVEEAVRDGLGKIAAAAVAWAGRTVEVDGAIEADRALRADGNREESPLDVLDGVLSAPTAATAPTALTQVFNSYIFYTEPDRLVLIDQHSAHERVLYEEVMTRIQSGGLPSQRLLLPFTLEFTDEELEAIETHGEPISRIGFEVDAFGGRSVVVHSVPAPHPRFDAERCLRELVSDLARGRFGGWANRLERFAATYACRAAIKAGEPLTEQEMRGLVTRLFACALPPHDVHGRASMVQLPREELERRFG
ncbi:MAG TPA: DNA mismatch repair endonuclease MutL, partial [Gemmatimonadales bacterium]|nr:DNA mismatch repair endonuclease MutL [Gemmatimonadales bacterium]